MPITVATWFKDCIVISRTVGSWVWIRSTYGYRYGRFFLFLCWFMWVETLQGLASLSRSIAKHLVEVLKTCKYSARSKLCMCLEDDEMIIIIICSSFTDYALWSVPILNYLWNYESGLHLVRLPGLGISPTRGIYLHRTALHRKTVTNVPCAGFKPTIPSMDWWDIGTYFMSCLFITRFIKLHSIYK
jgi:hypothetical protein